jgi:hypothetical protein
MLGLGRGLGRGVVTCGAEHDDPVAHGAPVTCLLGGTTAQDPTANRSSSRSRSTRDFAPRTTGRRRSARLIPELTPAAKLTVQLTEVEVDVEVDDHGSDPLAEAVTVPERLAAERPRRALTATVAQVRGESRALPDRSAWLRSGPARRSSG